MRTFLLALVFIPLGVAAQQGLTTFGFQVKPIIPLEYFDPLVELKHSDVLFGSYELESGISFGMSVRAGLTKSITLETGINQIRRRYTWKIVNDTAGFSASSQIRWTGYEIPIRGLVYVQLGERIFMNNALGFSFDMYPSNVVSNQIDAQAFIYRQRWVQLAVEGNIGVEYRTPKSGTLYFGASYHRPFGEMARGQLVWSDPASTFSFFEAGLSGTYLTFDIRYFFHEDPEKRSSRRGN